MPDGRVVSRPTMRHVAARAGVSVKTVSRVINDEPGVSVATAQRVTEAIVELDFRRNDLARSLRHGRSSMTLGLVIEDFGNPFYSAIAQAVEAVARARGYMVITGCCDEDPVREHELVVALLRRRVDALVLVPAARENGHAWLARELGADTPVVFLDRPPRGIEADAVLVDNLGGARSAVEHLLAHGHRRIAYVSDPPELFTAQQRLEGYLDALAAAGVAADPCLIRMQASDADGAEASVRELLALAPGERPTALFTGNNRHTVGALRALRAHARPPALVGFDDFEFADLLPVPTTVVRYAPQQLGEESARLAFARLDGDPSPPQRIIISTELLARGSGELRPPA